jgi:SAM-dependent methyltransferase
MPWYHPDLDEDLGDALNKLGLKVGTFLDLGTGPATQANKLHERGFEVTGVDISEDAILLATKTHPHIDFLQDDILNTKLSKKFDFIFDRGCFHVIDVNKRKIYAKNVFNLLNDSGLLFLKCFSNRMPDTGSGPHLISEKIIKGTFGRLFIIEEIKESEFKNERNPRTPKALFAIMKRRQ